VTLEERTISPCVSTRHAQGRRTKSKKGKSVIMGEKENKPKTKKRRGKKKKKPPGNQAGRGRFATVQNQEKQMSHAPTFESNALREGNTIKGRRKEKTKRRERGLILPPTRQTTREKEKPSRACRRKNAPLSERKCARERINNPRNRPQQTESSGIVEEDKGEITGGQDKPKTIILILNVYMSKTDQKKNRGNNQALLPQRLSHPALKQKSKERNSWDRGI